LGPALGNTQARFDTAKFNWIGNIVRDIASCGVWKSSPVRSWSDISTKTVRIGASGPDAITTQHALFLKNILGAKVDVILGYGGTNDINLAMQRGEVDGTCGMFLSSVTGPYQQDIKAGNLKIIIQFGRTNAPEFGDAANIYDLLKSDEDKQVTDFVFLQTELTRPIAAPPGVPADIVSALRKGFDDTMKDPEFLANAKKANIDIRPMTANEVATAFAQFAAMPPKVLERAKAAISNN
jgi:tripartite-type tricarboxylate transporter receptor subunit TctC